jgi:hypothetical protein
MVKGDMRTNLALNQPQSLVVPETAISELIDRAVLHELHLVI